VDFSDPIEKRKATPFNVALGVDSKKNTLYLEDPQISYRKCVICYFKGTEKILIW